MNPKKLAVLAVGVILLLMGVVFSLQGANVIGGSPLMSGNTEYIYIGAGVAVVGLVLLALSTRADRGVSATRPDPAAAP